MKGRFQPTTVGNMMRDPNGGYVCHEDHERLRTLAKAVLDTREAEAKTATTMQNAQANFRRSHAEACERAHFDSLVAAGEAEKALREALSTPNA